MRASEFMDLRQERQGGCTAKIFHGPGHQSYSYCTRHLGHEGPHQVTRVKWEWKGDDAITGPNDESPQEVSG